jgi:cellulose biosynthesis protein BcsQ
MKAITLVSTFPGCGQTTIAVNLAAALAEQGKQVLIVSLGDNEKLIRWLDINEGKGEGLDFVKSDMIYHSRRGADLLVLNSSDDISSGSVSSDLKHLDYDFLFLLPASEKDCPFVNNLSDYVLVCTDLSHSDEVEAIISLSQLFSDSQKSSLSLIVPNKINTKEWEHNSEQLFALADYFGYEKIADPIPFCERVHDLPLTGKTVWEINRENLKDAFNSLVEKVKEL